jgi:acetyl/propionyl-CoA carboxylase alpha subunit
VRLAEMVDYRSAGTVEYLYDTDSGKWYFLGEYTDNIGKFVTKIRQFF